MDKNKIELRVLQVFPKRMVQPEIITLVLGEVNGFRQFALAIGAAEAQAIVMELKSIYPPRPQIHQLFAGYLEASEAKMLRALIYKVEDGIFYAYIYIKVGDTIMRMDSRTSDAVAMALRMKAPIFIYEEILNELPGEVDKDSGRIAPIGDALDPETDDFFTDDSIELLEKALEKAIRNEDYERASNLRDEINRRKQQQQ
ncbi:MAG: DUF151 domain-containing protein [Mediterranea sp.]|jgi:bifunctional DNase/RNase|nr:DUF151 domain-containing protein [Mediterranea sp.]